MIIQLDVKGFKKTYKKIDDDITLQKKSAYDIKNLYLWVLTIESEGFQGGNSEDIHSDFNLKISQYLEAT